MRFELHDNRTGEFIDAIEVDTEGDDPLADGKVLGEWILVNVSGVHEPMIEVTD